LLNNDGQFCWTSVIRNDTKDYTPDPIADKTPDVVEFHLTEYGGDTSQSQASSGKEIVIIPVEVTDETDDEDNQSDGPSAKPTSTPPVDKKPSTTDDTFITLGDTWKYQPGWSEPPGNWMKKDFVDDGWYSGSTSIGYGDGEFSTDLSLSLSYIQETDDASNEKATAEPPKSALSDGSPQTDFTSVFLRREFPIDKPV
jgi:hypothetical protein